MKSNVNSISSSMILSPNVKRTINKNTIATCSNYRFKECDANISEGNYIYLLNFHWHNWPIYKLKTTKKRNTQIIKSTD